MKAAAAEAAVPEITMPKAAMSAKSELAGKFSVPVDAAKTAMAPEPAMSPETPVSPETPASLETPVSPEATVSTKTAVPTFVSDSVHRW